MTKEEALWIIRNFLYDNMFHIKSDIYDAMIIAELVLDNEVRKEKNNGQILL